MNNDLPFKVMIWGSAMPQSSFYFPTLESAGRFFIEKTVEFNCQPDDYPGSPRGELWYSWMPGDGVEIILCREYDVNSIDWENNTSNPPLQMLPTYRNDSKDLRNLFPSFRFEIWDEIPGDREIISKVLESAKGLILNLEDETMPAMESFFDIKEFLKTSQELLDKNQRF